MDMKNSQEGYKLRIKLKSIMYGVLATAALLTSCNPEDPLATVGVLIEVIPSGDPEVLVPPHTSWQVMVGDTNQPVKSHTNLLQRDDGSFTFGLGQEDLRFLVFSSTGVPLAEHVVSAGVSQYRPPVLADDEIVTSSGSRINPLTGATRWAISERGRFTPAEAGGMLVQNGYRQPTSLFTVDIETGNTELVQFIDSTQAEHLIYHFTQVIESSSGQKLIVLGVDLRDSLLPSGLNYQIQVRDFETFELRWSFDAFKSLVVYDARLAVAGDLLVLPIDDTMYGFNIETGDVAWQWTWDPPSYESVYGGNTKLSGFNFRYLDFDPSLDFIIAGGYEQVFAFQASTGEILWQRDMDDDSGVFIVNEEYAVYSTQVGYHVLIDINNGFEVGRITPLNDTYPSVHSRGFETEDGDGVVLFDGISIYAVEFETFELEEE